MSCCYPIDGWRAARVNDSGKRAIVFNPKEGLLDSPVQVPCGRCYGCSRDRGRVWAVRMYHESTLHDQNCFLTLTYDDAHLPPVLCHRDVQLFFKRLRSSGYKVRYFGCGEYGTYTKRPHYHVILYGMDFRAGAIPITDKLWTHNFLVDQWGKGFCTVGDVSIASCMYVAGYVSKKLVDVDSYNFMSRRPGIGRGWIEKHREELVRTGVVAIDGQEFAIPKKYLEWYDDDFLDVKRKRASYVRGLSGDDLCWRREHLRPREVNYRAKALLSEGRMI